MPTATRTATDRRRELAAIEGDALRSLLAAYRPIARTRGLVDALLAAITEAAAAGVRIDRRWLNQLPQFRELIVQLQAELLLFRSHAAGVVTDAQGRALAALRAEALVREALGELAALIEVQPVHLEPAENLVGRTRDGRPIAEVLGRTLTSPADEIAAIILDAQRRGLGADPVARAIAGRLGMPLVRSMTVARTELHRVYREGTRQALIDNAELLEGWVWRSARDSRVDAVCWAMDGTLFQFKRGTVVSGQPVIDIMPSHPSCRCSMQPRAKSYAEILGDPTFPDQRPPIVPGPDRFANLPPEDQQRILGPGRYELFRAGLPLRDMIGNVHDDRWGDMRVLTPLSRLPRPTKEAA